MSIAVEIDRCRPATVTEKCCELYHSGCLRLERLLIIYKIRRACYRFATDIYATPPAFLSNILCSADQGWASDIKPYQ
jgi:hypothetical protein